MGHLAAAELLTHPFAEDVQLEADAEFAVEGSARLGPSAGTWRSRQAQLLRKIHRALRPLGKWALARRPAQALPGMSPTFVAAMVAVLRWPGTELVMELARGCQLAGDIAQ